jgi:hypothetical protein
MSFGSLTVSEGVAEFARIQHESAKRPRGLFGILANAAWSLAIFV